jgi:hypothetical protein
MPITSGFARFDDALMRLVHRLPETTLEDKFNAISKWIDTYSVDVVPQRVNKVLAVVLAAGVGESKKQPAPNAPRAVAACFALQQLINSLCRARPVLTRTAEAVLQEIFLCIYMEPPRHNMFPTEGDGDAAGLIDTGDEHAIMAKLDAFRGKMYFQDVRDLQKKLTGVQRFVQLSETQKVKQNRVMDRAVKYWQGHLHHRIFCAWRHVVKQEKIERKRQQELHDLRAELDSAKEMVGQLRTKLKEETSQYELVMEQSRQELHAAQSDSVKLKLEIIAKGAAMEGLQAEIRRLKELLQHEEADKAAVRERHAVQYAAVVKGAVDFSLKMIGAQDATACADCDVLFPPPPLPEASEDASAPAEAAAESQPETKTIPVATDDTLLLWVQRVLSRHPQGERLRLTTIMGGGTTVEALMICARVLLPTAASEAMVSKVLQSSLSEKAMFFMHWARHIARLPIPTDLTADDIVSADSTGSVAASYLFRVFAALELCPKLCSYFGVDLKLPEVPAVPLDSSVSEEAAALITKGDVEAYRNMTPIDLYRVLELRHLEVERATRQLEGLGAMFASSALQAVSGKARAAGKKLTPEELADKPLFELSHDMVYHLVSESEMEAVAGLFDKHYLLLRSVFKHYSAADSLLDTTISQEEYWKLVVDARFYAKGLFDRTHMKQIFPTPSTALDARHWMAALVQTASCRYQSISIVEAVRTLLEEHLANYAEVTDLTLLMHEINTRSVQLVVEAIAPDMQKVFRNFSNPDSNRMAGSEFTRLLTEAKVLDETLSVMMAQQSFLKIKSPTENDIDFDTFVLVCCSLAFFRLPFPWMKSSVKIKKFLTSMLLKPFKTRFALVLEV